jgi:signal transduction histidine kinase
MVKKPQEESAVAPRGSHALELKAAEYAVLAEIGRIVSSTLNIDDIYEQFARQVALLIPFDRLSIAAIDLEAETSQAVYAVGGEIPGWERGEANRLVAGGISHQLARERKGILFRTPAEEEAAGHQPARDLGGDFQTRIAVPLFSRGEIVGALNIRSLRPNAYDEEQLALAERIGAQIAGTIANAFAYEKLAEAQKSLEKAVTELQRSNQELEQFAYVASHDLQEPLRKIASFCSLLEARYAGELDEKANTYIHFIVDGATRMQALVNDLLLFSRVTTRGKEFVPTDTAAALREALENLEIAMAECGAQVTHDDSLPTVAADPTQLTQLFQNLIGNAVKYRRDEAPRIHVSVEETANDWVFAVRDNGIGFEQEYADRIFIIFQRLHTREEFSGTGIGLAVCKKIVERHGGRIWVDSEAGMGSTFSFALPKQRKEDE